MNDEKATELICVVRTNIVRFHKLKEETEDGEPVFEMIVQYHDANTGVLLAESTSDQRKEFKENGKKINVNW